MSTFNQSMKTWTSSALKTHPRWIERQCGFTSKLNIVVTIAKNFDKGKKKYGYDTVELKPLE